jgi:hypothetical protein
MRRPFPIICVRWSPLVLVVLWAFAVLAVGVALLAPFPTNFDELQHLSVIRAQYEHPALFPDLSRYHILRADDLTRWSAERNYINHPSAYYLAMALFLHGTHNVLVARLLNVALATVALALVLVSGVRLFGTRLGKTTFAILAASFPKAVVIAGMVNNDNLAACAAALVFAGVSGMAGACWWLAAGLVLAGWSKLTALVALGTVVFCWQAWRIFIGERRWRSRDNLLLLAGALAGALPYLVTFVRTGHLLYVNEAHFWVPVDQRPVLDFFHFAVAFTSAMAMKWTAAEYSWPLALAGTAMVAPLCFAGLGVAADRRTAARIGAPYLFALAAMLAVHLAFGWDAFRKIGDLTTAQTRYYGILWPGLAMAGAMMVERLGGRMRWLAAPVIALYLLPTIIGVIVIGAVTTVLA